MKLSIRTLLLAATLSEARHPSEADLPTFEDAVEEGLAMHKKDNLPTFDDAIAEGLAMQ